MDQALAQEKILDGVEAPAGLKAMNFHKAAGKQFDWVVIVRKARRTAVDVDSSFTWQGNNAPHLKMPKRFAGTLHGGSRPCIDRQPYMATIPAFRRAQAVVGGVYLALASMGIKVSDRKAP